MNKRKLTFTTMLLLTIAFAMAQKQTGTPCPTSVSDYDGNTYNVVRIGDLCWMRENLRSTHYADGTSVDFERTESTITGFLYAWNVAKGIERGKQGVCPDGWYLPSDWEWQQMEIASGAVDKASANKMNNRGNYAYKLCSNIKNVWSEGYSSSYYSSNPYYPDGKCNTSGFSALPNEDVVFLGVIVGKCTNFWTATEFDKDHALTRHLENNSNSISRKKEKKWNAYSVRCVYGAENQEQYEVERNAISEESTVNQIDKPIPSANTNDKEIDTTIYKVYEAADTSDTLAIYDNGDVLHKLWLSSINKNIVGALISQPDGRIYRGFLYLRNVNEPTDILARKSIDCQHLLGAYEVGDWLVNVVYADSSEWGPITKTWECPNWRKSSDEEEKYNKNFYLIQQMQGLKYYYKTSITFNKDGTGYQTFTVAPEIIAQQIYTGYSNGMTGMNRKTGGSIRGGYKFTINGNAKIKFKWFSK